MRIQSISIVNVLGTKEAEFNPGTLTVVSGKNGSGKSSIIDALMSIFEGGHDPAALHKGAKKGVIELTLDNGVTITKTITEKSSRVEIIEPGDPPKEVSAPQTYINELAKSLAVNPARLLMAEQKQIVGELLELCPLEFSREEISAAVGEGVQLSGDRMQTGYIPDGTLNLSAIDTFRKQLFDARAQHNKSFRDSEGTVRDLKKTLPAGGDEKDWGAEYNRINELYNLTQTTVVARERKVSEAYNEASTAVVEEYAEKERILRQKLHDDLMALEVQKQDAIGFAKMDHDSSMSAIKSEFDPKIESLVSEAATAKERASQQQQAAGQRALIDQFNQKCRNATIAADKLAAAMEGIDVLKKQKLDALPIAGLEVRDGKVLVDGVEFPHVNTAKRCEIAFKLCAMRVGKLPFMVLDGAELMSSDTWAEFEKAAREHGFQVVAAKVTEGPLKIETIK